MNATASKHATHTRSTATHAVETDPRWASIVARDAAADGRF